MNQALKRMGYDELLTGHGIRATISTALNEIGYPKIWVDAQLSHCDPNKVSATYNHALHVEPRRRMMQGLGRSARSVGARATASGEQASDHSF